jgi:hypothetical protein
MPTLYWTYAERTLFWTGIMNMIAGLPHRWEDIGAAQKFKIVMPAIHTTTST